MSAVIFTCPITNLSVQHWMMTTTHPKTSFKELPASHARGCTSSTARQASS
jgi:hypothetical protein